MGEFILIASAVLGVAAQQQQAGAQEVEIELAKRKESSDARDREVQRKRRIAAILGAQAADAAAKGLQLSGSVANISIVDAKRASEESLIDDVDTRLRIDVLSRRSRSIRRIANLRSGATILNTAGNVSQRG